MKAKYVKEIPLNEELSTLEMLILLYCGAEITNSTSELDNLAQRLAQNSGMIIADFIDFAKRMGYARAIDTDILKYKFDEVIKKILGSSYNEDIRVK